MEDPKRVENAQASPAPKRSAGAGEGARDPESAPRPNPEVLDRPRRRTFSAEYKLRILAEADACTEPGQIGALLRREGLYSSHISTWRRQRREGALSALTPKKRGSKSKKNPLKARVAELEAENRKLKNEIKRARTIIEFQKKTCDLLDIPFSAERAETDGA